MILNTPPFYQVESLPYHTVIHESLEEWTMTNMALRWARKAQKRKQVVAQKRRAEAQESSLPARVLRAANAPIQHCFLSESLF